MQVHPLGVRIRRQARQDPAVRVARRRRVPAGREDQDPRPSQLAHDVGEQNRRRLVRPLQIIKHQQEPAPTGRLRQPPANLGEPRRTARTAGRCRNRRHQPAPGARRRRTHATTSRDWMCCPHLPGRRAHPAPAATGRTAASCPGRSRKPTPRPRPATPPAAADTAISSARRVFPIPASPAQSTRRPRPARASPRSSVTRASSRSRPTISPVAP